MAIKLTKLHNQPIAMPDGTANPQFKTPFNQALTAIETAFAANDVAIAEIATAQATANSATTAAGTAQSTANAANSAAAAAASAAAAAQVSADAANGQIANYAADNKLMPSEKKGVMLDYQAITDQQSDIDAKAVLYGVTTEKTNYDAAVTALTSYLGTLTSPSLWNNLAGPTDIVGTTFRSKFADVYAKRQLLLNKIAQVAGTVSTWGGTSGTPGNLTALTGSEAIQNTLVALGQNQVINSDFNHTGDFNFGWIRGTGGNTGLVIDCGVNLNSSYSGQLNVGWCHVAGTPAAGTYFDGHLGWPDTEGNALANFKRWGMPVFDGEHVFVSALLANHRCSMEVKVFYWDGTGTYVGEWGSNIGFSRSFGAGSGDPANFNRVAFFHTVPTNARYATIGVRGYPDGSSADPYIFYTQMMMCKVAAGQTAAPAYNSGPADRSATYGADLGANVTGRLTNGGGYMPVNWNGGIKAINTGFALTDTVVNTTTCQINIAATTWQFDNGNVVNYPSGTISGCAYATTYYVYRTDPALNGGSSYGASTDIANAQSTSKVYFGYMTTRASSGSGTGGTGGGGGTFNCVAIDAFVPTERGLLPAHEVVAGDRVRTLTKSLDGTAWETVEENVVGDNYCVRITTKSASLTLAHNTPIIDRNGAWTMAANAHVCHLPVLLNGKVVWEKCESVEHVGKKPVMKLRCNQAIYAAGDTSGAFILTHNPFGSNTQKP